MARESFMAPADHKYALVILLPQALWKHIQPARALLDKAFDRWPPHITILWPFTNDAAVHSAVKSVFAQTKAFTAKLGPISFFKKRRQLSLHHEIKSVDLTQLHGEVLRALAPTSFPKPTRPYHAHLTLGQANALFADQVPDLFRHAPKKVAFLVAGAHLLRQDSSGVYQPVAEFPFQACAMAGCAPYSTCRVPPFRAFPPARFGERGWEEVPPPRGDLAAARFTSTMPRALSVFSWNCLCDAKLAPAGSEAARVAALRGRTEDVLVLQEVSPQLLLALASDEQIRRDFFFSDISGHTLVHHGQLVLSRFPILTCVAHRFALNKRIVAVVLAGPTGEPFPVIAVHLTSGFRHGPLDGGRRRAEQAAAIAKLACEFPSALIVGDFNARDSFPLSEFATLLPPARVTDSFRPRDAGDLGLTFDTEANKLAALTSKTHLPARFDRVLARGAWVPRRHEVLRSTSCPSDHFPVSVTVEWAGASPPPALALIAHGDVPPLPDPPAATFDFGAVFEAVRDFLEHAVPRCSISVVGSCAFGIHDSDIDLLLGASFPPAQCISKIEAHAGGAEHITIERKVEGAIVPVLVLHCGAVKIDVSLTGPRQPAEGKALAKSSVTDAQALLARAEASPSGVPVFRRALRFLRGWFKREDIFLHRFGYLGSFQISVMLAMLLPAAGELGGGDVEARAARLVAQFFHVFSSWPWRHWAVSVGGPVARAPCAPEPMEILTPTEPVRNSMRNATESTAAAVVGALRRAHCTLVQNQYAWCLLEPPARATELCRNYLEIRVGAHGRGEMCTWQGYLESRLAALLCDLEALTPRNNRLPLFTRPVPRAFLQDEDPRFPTQKGLHRRSLLIGLEGAFASKPARLFAQRTAERWAEAENRWRERTHAMEPVSCGFLTAAEAAALTPHTEAAARSGGGSQENIGEPFTVPKGTPLRTCIEVLNRIRWDTRFDEADFTVLYEDRFLGLKAIPAGRFLDQLKSTETDSIPAHRVYYIKCGDIIVWDRKERMDRMSSYK
eukprot:gnl/Chilomastix_cuspidata/1850.p1 GENE.gnl/Chilomastix_cuspidata/1850~~gnl/Chilomastix_cuspidata/1850.p1  ORF type:complete len:1014 (-),score=379.42 gnl/Chilomastix_cuspidata/1850:70-3111(-)